MFLTVMWVGAHIMSNVFSLTKVNSNCRVSPDLFGGNYIFTHDQANISDDSIEWAYTATGLTTWRYPGGTVSEEYFDITDNAHFEMSSDPIERIYPDGKEMMPMGKFFSLAAEMGSPINVVIPTSPAILGDLDKINYNPRDIDHSYIEAVEEFVTKAIEVARYYGVQIDSFEIGNEYWGHMSSTEYGAVAGQMVKAVNKSLELNGYNSKILIETVHSQNGVTDPDNNYSDQISLIAEQIGAVGAADMVDGIAQHIYAKTSELDDEGEGKDQNTAFYTAFQKMEDKLIHYGRTGSTGTLEYHVTEWNLKKDQTEEYGLGLKQATILVEMMYKFVKAGVDAAQVWKVTGTGWDGTSLTLTRQMSGSGTTAQKHSGAVFNMMQESIVGLNAAGNGDVIEGPNHQDLEFSSYANDSRVVFFFVNQSEENKNAAVDLGEHLASFGNHYFLTSTKLGDNVSGNASNYDLATASVNLTYQNSAEMKLLDNVINLEFSDWEIVRVEVIDITSGADEVIGRGADEFIYGLGGDDILVGSGGDDILEGGEGADYLDGGEGTDTISYASSLQGVYASLANPTHNNRWRDTDSVGDAYQNAENLTGTNFSDKLIGNNSDNLIIGRDGNDTLISGLGNDVVRGKNGADMLLGGVGDDKLIGGNGADTFIFKDNWGNDVIKDFEDDIDVLKFHGMQMDEVEDAFDHATEVGSDVLFQFDDSTSVRVKNISLAELVDDVLV